jgi:hypothetical protein
MCLLYPGLREVPLLPLREALYAHRRELVRGARAAVMQCGGGGGGGVVVGDVELGEGGAGGMRAEEMGEADGERKGVGKGGMGRKRRRDDDDDDGQEGEVGRCRRGHPESWWMSDAGVEAARVFEAERARWLRKGWLVDLRGGSVKSFRGEEGGVQRDTGLGPWAGRMREAVMGDLGGLESNVEPSDEEVRSLKQQCRAIGEAEERHVRSMVCYLRRRRWQREVLGMVGMVERLGWEKDVMSVPVELIKKRIGELMRESLTVRGAVAKRANGLRVQELQRLLDVAGERTLAKDAAWKSGGGMVNKAVQTVSAPALIEEQVQGLTALPRMATAEDASSSGDNEEDESDADGSMDLDELSQHSGETIESDDYQDYRDLIEEFHGRLL